MSQRSLQLWGGLFAFVAAGTATYSLVPSHKELSLAHKAANVVRRNNIFAMVHTLADKNNQLATAVQGINADLGHAQHQLGILQKINQSLAQETRANAAVVNTLSQEVALNQNLVSSQQNILSRETATLHENQQVGANIRVLGIHVHGVMTSMTGLYQTTGGLDTNLSTLSNTLATVLSQLQLVQANTSLPILHVPITSILPTLPSATHRSILPILSTPSSSKSAKTGSQSLISNPVQNLLGGL